MIDSPSVLLAPPARPLRRVLGLGFGLAMAFGGTVGVGILRLPATLAASLGDARLIVAFWIFGGIWALLGAVAVAELTSMMPEAGGFYVYARRAFGKGAGFVVGWSDWLNQVAAMVYAALTAALFLGQLWTPAADAPRLVAIAVLVGFTGLHWVGLQIGSSLTRAISLTVGLMMIVLVVACFAIGPATPFAAVPTGAAAAFAGSSVAAAIHKAPSAWLSMATVGAAVTALRAVFVSYDGWYSPIYMSEESTDPTRTLPQAILGGTVVLAALYVIINVAVLRVLPIPAIAASALPAADAARIVFPKGGAELVTVISLLTVLSLINAILLMAPRILLAIGRDGMFTQQAVVVSAGGTPRLALIVTTIGGVALLLSGTFEQIVAIAAVLFLLNYVSAYIALFLLRRREPLTPRPYRTAGFPVSTAIVLSGCIALEIAAIVEDPRSGAFAAVLLLACWPVYGWLSRRRGFKRQPAPTPP